MFYDGGCGLCHWSVRQAAAIDRRGDFLFAPIGGETFRARVAAGTELPDSIVLLNESGELLTRSAAVIHLLRRSGGPWSIAAAIAWLIPRPLRDWLYDRIAAARQRWFAKPADVCPVMPPELRRRFLP